MPRSTPIDLRQALCNNLKTKTATINNKAALRGDSKGLTTRHIMEKSYLLFFVLLHLVFVALIPTATAGDDEGSESSAKKKTNHHVQVDPDTTCSDVYRKTPTKEVCLSNNDHFLRPCCFCVDKQGNDYCYNIDEAKWASI